MGLCSSLEYWYWYFCVFMLCMRGVFVEYDNIYSVYVLYSVCLCKGVEM